MGAGIASFISLCCTVCVKVRVCVGRQVPSTTRPPYHPHTTPQPRAPACSVFAGFRPGPIRGTAHTHTQPRLWVCRRRLARRKTLSASCPRTNCPPASLHTTRFLLLPCCFSLPCS